MLQIVSVPPSPTELPGAYLYREAYRLLLRDPNVVMLSNNTANARDFERWLEVSRGTVKLLRNGFLPSSVQIRRAEEIVECRRQFGLPPNVSVVGALRMLGIGTRQIVRVAADDQGRMKAESLDAALMNASGRAHASAARKPGASPHREVQPRPRIQTGP